VGDFLVVVSEVVAEVIGTSGAEEEVLSWTTEMVFGRGVGHRTVDGKKILEMIAIESVVQTGEMIDESILGMKIGNQVEWTESATSNAGKGTKHQAESSLATQAGP